MDDSEIQLARSSFRARIDSLRNDVMRCFWPITTPSAPVDAPAPVVANPPQYALFPAVMYCFSTVDYFSSFWAGWNDPREHTGITDNNQTRRMTGFLNKYLRYPVRAAFIAVKIWRHKLMHTAEPRQIKCNTAIAPNKERVYLWAAGAGGSFRDGDVVSHHMRLTQLPLRNPGDLEPRSRLYFDCYEFVRDLEEGIFGPTGYFTDLVKNAPYDQPVKAGTPTKAKGPTAPTPDLQKHYSACFAELESYTLDFAEVGLPSE
jgi:hypothetical protein